MLFFIIMGGWCALPHRGFPVLRSPISPNSQISEFSEIWDSQFSSKFVEMSLKVMVRVRG